MESIINPICIELGKKIKLERERLDLSQDAFAAINDLTGRTIIEWEKGNTFPNLFQLVKLSDAGLNINSLFNNLPNEQKVNQLSCGKIGIDVIFHLPSLIKELDEILKKNPTWNLINIETFYSKSGDEIGIYYYYTYPLPKVN